MSDRSANTERTWTYRGVVWGIVLTGCALIVLIRLDAKERIDLNSWIRSAHSTLSGRESYRDRIHVSMTRAEVRKQIGESRDQATVMFWKDSESHFGPTPGGTPHAAVKYPEYGIVVIYDDIYSDPLNGWSSKRKAPDDWKVIAIDDLP